MGYTLLFYGTTDTVYGNEKFFTTLEATATPIPTITTVPICEIKSLKVYPKRQILRMGKSRIITIVLKGKNDCSTGGKIVEASVDKISSKRISITPESQSTDENGKVEFTITANYKVGKGRVIFESEGLRKSFTIRVRR